MLALRERLRNLHRYALLDALSAVRTKEDAQGNLRPWFDFAELRPRVLDRRDPALRQQIQCDIDALQPRGLHIISEKLVELIPPPSGEQHRRRYRHLTRSNYVRQ